MRKEVTRQHISILPGIGPCLWPYDHIAYLPSDILSIFLFFFLFTTNGIFWTSKLPTIPKHPILKAKFPLFNPALPHYTWSILSSLNHCWQKEVTQQRVEQLDPVSTEFAVTLAPVAGQSRGHHTSACLHSFSGQGKGLRPTPNRLSKFQNVAETRFSWLEHKGR